jgi:hypothetical protein
VIRSGVLKKWLIDEMGQRLVSEGRAMWIGFERGFSIRCRTPFVHITDGLTLLSCFCSSRSQSAIVLGSEALWNRKNHSLTTLGWRMPTDSSCDLVFMCIPPSREFNN